MILHQLQFGKFKFIFSIILFLTLYTTSVNAQINTPIRRTISPQQPTWIIHIDTWVNADPKKIIEMVPEDIRPFVIFNVSLSASDPNSGPYGPFADGPMMAETWVRTCAEYGVWVTIQAASGYATKFPLTFTNDDIFEYFFKTYSNFLGFNYAEQSWGFPTAASFDVRLQLFADLLTLANKYGGYLFVSSTQTMNAPAFNAVAMLKRSSAFRAATVSYKENYVLSEKYTTSRGFYDIESTCLGTYLSGLSGNYGIRFDECGWTMWGKRWMKPFPDVLGIIPTIEHAIFTGQTVVDGPELTWSTSINGDGTTLTPDGYRSKKFKLHGNFINNNLDFFRKALDGSFRIPSREEVIQRTKVAFVNDATTGNERNMYSTEQTLFTGLYAYDGEWDNNNGWTKKSGRYPTIPTIYTQSANTTGGFGVVVNKANFATRWGNIQTKVNEFNTLFPEEYTGNIYAARIKNTWMTYNPYMQDSVAGTPLVLKNTPASGTIPFKYNTCEKMEITHSNYALAVIHEYSEKLDVYLNNYISKIADEIQFLREDTIRIYGSTNKPTYTYTNRGGTGSGTITIAETWANNIFTLTVSHNGPLDLTINCAGTATNRLTDFEVTPTIITPAAPSAYTGPRQYEAEDFEYKNVTGIAVKEATLLNYTGLGYMRLGNLSNASIRQIVTVPAAGTYQLKTKYCAPTYAITTQMGLYINGIKVATSSFPLTTDSVWNVQVQNVNLIAGENCLEFRASSSLDVFHIDNVIIESVENAEPISEPDQTIYSFEWGGNGYTSDGGVTYTNLTQFPSAGTGGTFEIKTLSDLGATAGTDGNTSIVFHGMTNTNNTASVDLTAFPSASDQQAVWKTYLKTSTTLSKGIGVILRAQTGASSYSASARQGYFFSCYGNGLGNVIYRIRRLDSGGYSDIKGATAQAISGFTNGPLYLKTKVVGTKLYFEYSIDGTTYTAFPGSPFTDATYSSGTVQLAWGLGASNLDQYYDDVVLTNLDVPTVTLVGNDKYTYTGSAQGPSSSTNTFFKSTPTVTYNYEGIGSTSYTKTTTAPSAAGTYMATVDATFGSQNAKDTLAYEILPTSVDLYYTFNDDVVGTAAANTSYLSASHLVQNNTGYMLGYKSKGKMLQNTGNSVTTLTNFGTSTNYSVIWKDYATATFQKRGVILRGDASNTIQNPGTGTTNTGYGYLFYVVNTSETNIQMDIRKLTGPTSGPTTLVSNGSIAYNNINKAVWYRATVDGSTITFAYSSDAGSTWTTACTTTDATYTSGLTQVSAINSGGTSYYSDYFGYKDLSNISLAGGGNWSTVLWPLTPNVNSKITLTSGELIVDNNQTVNSITLNPGAKLTLNSGKTLNLRALNINSDASGTATFVNNGTATITTSKVQQYLTNQSWYLTSPVSGTVTPTNLSRIQSYIEGDGDGNTWSVSGTTMTAGKGYITSVSSAPNTIEFTGTINNGNISIPLTRFDASDANKYGFNLIGNPYSAYLDWKLVSAANSTKMPTSTMWYRTKVSGGWDFSTVNGAGETSPENVSYMIPPMQAFWVRASTVGNSTLSLTTSMIAHDNSSTNKLKAPVATKTERTKLRLQVSNGTNSDELLIYTDANASNAFDWYDSSKMSNENVDKPEISSVVGTESLVINGLNSLLLDTELPIRFMTKTANAFSLKANQVSNLPEGVKVILSDYGTEFDLTSGAEYNFTSDIADNTIRFSVIFRSTGAVTGLNKVQDNQLMVYSDNNGITLRANDEKLIGTEVSVYNAIGQKLISKYLNTSTMHIEYPFSPDVYLVKVNNITKKVILK